MLSWLKRLLWDETAFVGLLFGTFRALVLALGGAVAGGFLDVEAYGLPRWLGLVCFAAAGFLKSNAALGNGHKKEDTRT